MAGSEKTKYIVVTDEFGNGERVRVPIDTTKDKTKDKTTTKKPSNGK